MLNFRHRGFWVTVIVLLFLFFAWSCSKKDNDTLIIQNLISSGAASAQKHDIGDIMKHADAGFTAMPGNYDAHSVKRVLFAVFRRYGKFKIYHHQPSVQIDKTNSKASAAVHFLIVREDMQIPGLRDLYNDPGQWLETAREKADLYQLKLELAKPDDQWKVTRAEVEGFKGYGF
ncbi:MAG: hypothetical protein GY874_12085 [Desulfobacteraceae bacterium]|nr:hypothetical protein [Desulfobacteraceae bacterium]